MEMSEFRGLFTDIFQKNGLEAYIREEYIEKFYELTNLMMETNRVMNITALTTEDKIIPLHYADSVRAAEWIPQNAYVADIGCGGGFPILPLSIVRPDLKIVGIDSTAKKVRYVNTTAEKLGLSAIAVAGRAEDANMQDEYRETFDVVISRAVARLNILDELCIPYVKIGGKFVAMKGAAGQEEMVEAKKGIEKLGGTVNQIQNYELFTTDSTEKRAIIEIQKIQSTPKEFPRGFGAIKKKPL